MKTNPTIAAFWIAACSAYAAPGDLDTSFGGTGQVIVTFPGQTSEGSAVAVYPDGNILASGRVGSNFAVLRFSKNGTLDTSFNGTGKSFASFSGSVSYPTSMAVGSNGQVILAGYSNGNGGPSFAVARFDEDGFNISSEVINVLGMAEGVAIQPDGKFVIVGNNGSSFTAVRFTAAGGLDNSFDSDGRVGFALHYGSNASGVAVQADGKIVMAGKIRPTQNTDAFMVMRLNPNGSLDTSFAGTGYVATPVGTAAAYGKTVTIAPDGKLVIAGHAAGLGGDGIDYAVVRYNPNGTLDTSFNGTGKAIASVGQFDVTMAATLQSDGKILVGGASGMVRFTSGGIPDSSFGQGGKVGTPDYNVNGIAMQPDGQILTAGADGTGILLARYHSGLQQGLVVEQPEGTKLSTGDTQARDFGTVIPGQTAALVITIRNQGLPPALTGLAVTKTTDGNPADYTIGPLGAVSLADGESTTFSVTFAPSVEGTRTAVLRVASSDPDENPFVINLTGRGATKVEVWRQGHFGTFDSEGDAADTSDPDRDGIVNFLEYATGNNPLGPTQSIGQLVKTDSGVEFTFTRPKSVLSEIGYALESSATMSGAWINTGTGITVLSDNGVTQTVRIAAPLGSFGKRFYRLRVTRQ